MTYFSFLFTSEVNLNFLFIFRQGLKLRQLTDGYNFIQLIYTIDDVIQDCEFIRQKKIIEKFLNTFRRDVERAKIFYQIDNEVQNEENAPVENERKRQERSVDENDYIEDEYDEDNMDDEGTIERYSINEEDIDEDDSYEFRNVTFQILQDDDDLPGELAEWMDFPMLKAECKRTHRLLKRLVHDSQHGNEETKKLAQEHFER